MATQVLCPYNNHADGGCCHVKSSRPMLLNDDGKTYGCEGDPCAYTAQLNLLQDQLSLLQWIGEETNHLYDKPLY